MSDVSPSADRKITIVSAAAGSLRMVRHSSNPSCPGIITSSSTRSGPVRRTISSALAASRAARMRWPVPCSVRTSTWRLTGLSSTTRIVARPGGPAPSALAATAFVERRRQRACQRRQAVEVELACHACQLMAERLLARVAGGQFLRQAFDVGHRADGQRLAASATRSLPDAGCRAAPRSSPAPRPRTRTAGPADRAASRTAPRRGPAWAGSRCSRRRCAALRVSPKALAVTAMTGMWAVPDRRAAAWWPRSPSRSGILRSMNTTLGWCLAVSSTASTPPAAVITCTPALSSSLARIRRFTVLSSTTSASSSCPGASRAFRSGAAASASRSAGRDRRGDERQREVEAAAFPDHAFHLQIAAHPLQQLLADGQSQAGPADGGAALGLGEGLEDGREALGLRFPAPCPTLRTAGGPRRGR